MILSNQKIDYSSVRRILPVKSTGQTQGIPPPTTTNTMPTSTSLQDINSHAQKFTWNDNNDNDHDDNNNNNHDKRLASFPEKLLSSSKPFRPLTASQSDDRIFEHPEVTIKPSALDDEIQRRLLTMKISNTLDNLDRDAGQSAPNILEHPDMRLPVIMQPQQMSSSNLSSAFFIQNNCRRVSRTQSAEVYPTTHRTPSPGKRVDFFIDNQQNSKQSASPGSFIDDIIESPEQEKNEDPQTTATDSTCEYSKPSSKSDNNILKTQTDDSW